MAGYYTGSVGNYYRYFIATIPLGVMMVGVLLSRGARLTTGDEAEGGNCSQTSGPVGLLPQGASASQPHRHRRTPVAYVLFAALAAVVLAAPSVVTTGAAMFNRNIGYEESGLLDPVFHHKDPYSNPTVTLTRTMATYIADQHLPDGDVIVDNSTECVPGVITTISDPKVFVIPNDRDFQRILADPLTFNTHYILIPPNSVSGGSATNKLYPTLYRSGDGFAKLVHQFANGACLPYRLYRVISHTAGHTTG